MKKSSFFLFVPLIFLNCGNRSGQDSVNREKFSVSQEFAKYWYAGKAEITSYKLYQARYGEIHEGSAVTIFVTEDFSASKHVKLDNPKAAGSDAINVLKLNLIKKFNTGIYPYSMMLSVFKPINTGELVHALKVSVTSQEWCGNTFTQVDNEKDKFRIRLFSYFESEGDKDKIIPAVWFEDELWNQVRINPALLPVGHLQVLPGLLQQRLLHLPIEATSATAILDSSSDAPDWLKFTGKINSYSLLYGKPERKLIIYFDNKFPYSIAGWEESYLDPFGKEQRVLTTKAIRQKTIITDYWNRHNNADNPLRDTLELNYN